MSYELEPLQKAGSTLLDRRRLAHDLFVLAKNSPITSSRANQPSIRPFFTNKDSLAMVERLVKDSENPDHPTKAFAVFRPVGVNKTVLSGFAMAIENIEVYANARQEKRRKLQDRRTVCMAWLSIGKVTDLANVYSKVISQTAQGNEIAIEPQTSATYVHDAIATCFSIQVEGTFALGQGRAPNLSIAYGLSPEDLTRIALV